MRTVVLRGQVWVADWQREAGTGRVAVCVWGGERDISLGRPPLLTLITRAQLKSYH